MPKFRKKPVIVEAVHLTWRHWSEMCVFAGVGKLSKGHPEGCYIGTDGKPVPKGYTSDEMGLLIPNEMGLLIPTLEGLMIAHENDWIIKGVKGELYPCKPDIFEATYEPIE
jgi:hypothetical protein